MATLSKAKRIRELYAQGKTTREIADLVGCRPEYVRVAARQRADKAYSVADERYLCKKWAVSDIREAFNKQRRYRYRNDASFRARITAANRISRKVRYRTDPEFRKRLNGHTAAWRQRQRMKRTAAAEGRA